ncbi:tail terminator [Mycobacterium phage Nicholas]|uniref:Tail terminator n=1 Tax=Mycobacterium phage Lumos TaxID=1701852 RepID=A0A0K2CM52_9CAUD|nr:tail terminator [Mycobacterium phage Snenia]YP_010012471.1 tail terminator [Mycobacterium phage Lumos]ASM62751.1 tail terminator [Mycobacterium phage Clautastrophe]ASR86943.1 tail terminator [Mycobacterium phage Kingsolomon]ASR87285.1 tail terminator [Mycobacterium phage Nicholas]AYB70368.1 tail terminator [Mycobacterium phage Samty]QDF16598.1 tail terminator [Mycobacterium phage MsGreen]QDK03546.1 tail terminator [Mycobacterium phage Finnry]QPL14897.1 tail terminator [Mycobacterium phag
MALELPDWYEDPFVNVENLFIDIFSALLPGVITGCWAPDDWLEQATPDPTLWFFRLPGGQVDFQGRKDECQLQATIVTGNRDDSWALMNFVRAMLLPLQGDKFKMADGYTAQIRCAGEISGPQLLTPGQRIDNRVINAVFKVSVNLKTAKDYKQYFYAASS